MRGGGLYREVIGAGGEGTLQRGNRSRRGGDFTER